MVTSAWPELSIPEALAISYGPPDQFEVFSRYLRSTQPGNNETAQEEKKSAEVKRSSTALGPNHRAHLAQS
jgi:hypothetical protein